MINKNTKPFLKWAGGKRSLAKLIGQRLPEGCGDYFEPFLGGGAVFFHLRPPYAHLSDINTKLINVYLTLRDCVDAVIDTLACYKEQHSQEFYYKIRKAFNSGGNDSISLAADFIYLNKTGFNGLYRENKNGMFNVPFGKYKNPKIFDEANLRSVSHALKHVDIQCRSFTETPILEDAFYYLDPPYHDTYTAYTKDKFTEEDQMTLAEFCKDIDWGGGYFMLSKARTGGGDA